MRWIGLNGGYVSGDGRFLVAQVTVKGKRGDVQKWALYGLVHITSENPVHVSWGWGEQPLHGPTDTKRACQEWAATHDYEPLVVGLDAPTQPPAPVKRTAWEVCQECGVDYPRPKNHPYTDLCGPNCLEIQEERVAEIRQNLQARPSLAPVESRA